jgi:3-methyladenine DNA glycosylase AlkC
VGKLENPNAFKLWINQEVAQKYFSSDFDPVTKKAALKEISSKLDSLELKDRVRLISRQLHHSLPSDFSKALKILLRIAKSQNLKSFELWPATDFIQTYGLHHVDESIEAMLELTQRFTAEFCIRPFINLYGIEVYKKLYTHLDHPNEHVRRWLSEGTRPRLPWGEKLSLAIENPVHGLKILEKLKWDSSLYVRKSIANHLNDIAKDHPGLVIKTLKQWSNKVPKSKAKEFNFIVNRALRTMIKDGDSEALKLIGIDAKKSKLKTENLKINKTKFKMGEALILNFVLQNKGQNKIKFVVDYLIYFQKANGHLAPKVFKLKTGWIEPGQVLPITKKHSFKPITTRKYHSGLHKISLKVNGLEMPAQEFNLSV